MHRVCERFALIATAGELATQYGCNVAVVVPQDKAWDTDPFANAPDYRLAEAREGRWRIYMRRQ